MSLVAVGGLVLIILGIGVAVGLQAFGFALLWYRNKPWVHKFLGLGEHHALHAVGALRRRDPVLPESAGYAVLHQALADVYQKDRREGLPQASEIKFFENRGTSIAGRPVVHVVWSGGESPVEIDDLEWAVQLRLDANRILPAAKFFLWGLGVSLAASGAAIIVLAIVLVG